MWLRLTAAGAVAGTGLAVVSGAAGWDTAHRLLAALALPPLAALAVAAWISRRSLLPASLVALVAFGFAAALTAPGIHLAVAALAFAAAAFAFAQALRLPAGGGTARDYLTLTKPRIMSLLLLTGGAGVF
ncbi:MAG: hypothetical protein ACJ76R_05690, partial [Solirubrobacteraceae bacterium]